ncbi:hypothetical protein SLS56_011830 [Neofusicoccum ribis]|uniref:AhpD-like protein n=1 Tax=Neofusicoccum ribis TaxID=45134 RepID=A0ABR3SB50_9PEZI
MTTDQSPEHQQKHCLVPYLDDTTASPSVAKALSALPYRRNIFMLMGHSAGLFPPVMGVYSAVFNNATRQIPILDWQLIVLRIAGRLDAEYEWDVNSPLARQRGMPASKLAAMSDPPEEVQHNRNGVWTDRDRAILRLVDEQLASYTNSEETVHELRRFVSVEELLEIYIILGMYALIARITKGLRIDLDGEIPGLEEAMKSIVPEGGSDC